MTPDGSLFEWLSVTEPAITTVVPDTTPGEVGL